MAKGCNRLTSKFLDARIVNIDIEGGVNSGRSGNNVILVGHSQDVKVLGNKIHDTGIAANGEHHSHPIYLENVQSNTEVESSVIQVLYCYHAYGEIADFRCIHLRLGRSLHEVSSSHYLEISHLCNE